jgi:hypothetical protein
MKYIKTFESFNDESFNEKITDYFKTKEEIADGFLKALKEDKEKALESIISYYDDFTNGHYWHKTPQILPNFYRLFPKEYFQPENHGSFGKENGRIPGSIRKYESKDPYIPTPEDWKSDKTGTNSPSFINKKALDLTDKITKKEVLDLLHDVKDFSLKGLVYDVANILTLGLALPQFNPGKTRGHLMDPEFTKN